jgi:hypothetical protein
MASCLGKTQTTKSQHLFPEPSEEETHTFSSSSPPPSKNGSSLIKTKTKEEKTIGYELGMNWEKSL